MARKSVIFALCALAAQACFVSCGSAVQDGSGGSQGAQEQVVSVVNWNVETFFDSVTDGNEYEQFVSSKSWGHDAYVERLKRLASVVQALDADVFVMEELENEGVLHDIYNFLAGEWNQRKIYAYGCFAKDEGSSIGCGVLSRYPLVGMSVHALDVRTEDETMPRMRPLMEVSLAVGGRTLVLLVSHWKSMLGGEEKTERWRLWQESVLCSSFSRRAGEGSAVISCGDYNRDVMSFAAGSRPGSVSLRSMTGKGALDVACGWFLGDGSLVQPGSYYYSGWSRIDNFFAAGSARIVSFAPQTDGPWCDSGSGIPEGYKIWTGKGYSDHLPVKCVVSF